MIDQALIARIYSDLQAKRFDAVIAMCDRELPAHHKSAELYHLKALAQRGMSNLPGAISTLQTAISLSPGNAEMLNTLGNMYKKAGAFDAAEQCYRTALQASPDYTPAHKNLSSLLTEIGRLDDAVSSAERFIESTQVRNGDAFEALGKARKAQKAWRKAKEAFEQAVKLDASHVGARYGLAASLIEIGEAEAAKNLCAALIQEGVTQQQILRLLARAELELSQFAAAEPQLEQAIRLGSAEAVKDYTNLLWMTERAGQAEQLVRGAISVAAQRPAQALSALDEILNMERPELLVELYAGLPEEARRSPVFLSRLSMARSELGANDEAFALIETARKAEPHHPQIAHQFIVSALVTGRYELAYQTASELHRIDSHDQNWIALQATALRMLGRLDAYHELYDYDRFVVPLTLDVPDGFQSLADFHDAFIEAVHGNAAYKTHPLGQSARQGIQSPRNLVFDQREVVQAYLKALRVPIASYLERLGQDDRSPLARRNHGAFHIGGCWSISLLKGGRHVSHVHPKGWVSSAYYMAVPPETLEPSEEKPGWIKFGEPPYAMPDPAPTEHWVQPKAGTLVLFPAYMWHGTMPISGQAPRVTAPLDILPGDAP